MWVRWRLPRVLVVALAATLASCKASETQGRTVEQYLSFKTNGRLFAHNLLMSDGPALFVSGINGMIHEIEPPSGCRITEADVGQTKTIYTCYFVEFRKSEIYICDQNFVDCSKKLEMEGSIANPVFFHDERTIIFQHSPYVAGQHVYTRYSFHKLDTKSGITIKYTHPLFTVMSPAIALDDRVVFGAVFGNVFRNEGPTVHNSFARVRHDYYATFSGRDITIEAEDVDLAGGYNLEIYFKIGDTKVYFGGLNSDPVYIYYTCITSGSSDDTCGGGKEETSPPDVYGGKIFYSKLDYKNKRAEIFEFPAGGSL